MHEPGVKGRADVKRAGVDMCEVASGTTAGWVGTEAAAGAEWQLPCELLGTMALEAAEGDGGITGLESVHLLYGVSNASQTIHDGWCHALR